MNRLPPFALSLFGVLLLTSTVTAYSRADASATSAQPIVYDAASFATLASATDTSQDTVVRHSRHRRNALNQADMSPLNSDAPGQNPGWLIGVVILGGSAIFGLTHLRKS